MGSSRPSLKQSLLLTIIAAVLMLSAVGLAQADSSTTSSISSDATTSPTSSTTTASSSSDTSQTTSSESSSSNNGDMPTLASATGTSLTIPTVAVPPTNNAPFMQQSAMPEGTVFIAVGAILGAFGVALLAWRAVIAWLLHRSVERAAKDQQRAIDKSFPAPPPPFYTYTDRGSLANPSGPGGGAGQAGLYANTGSAGRGVRRTSRGPNTPSATPGQSHLFFSPTAPGATNSMAGASAANMGGGMAAPGNRDSRYLPSGFYASAGTSTSQAHGHSASMISLNNLQPLSRATAGMGPSPPDSPGLNPAGGARRPSASGGPGARNFSSSSLSLGIPGQRAPSAFLDDLLDDRPELFPSQGGLRRRSRAAGCREGRATKKWRRNKKTNEKGNRRR